MKLTRIFKRDSIDAFVTRRFKQFFVNYFIKTYYGLGRETWKNSTWLGVSTLKAPTDLWVYQEMIMKFRPDFIIECGTFKGGSALYMASIMDMVDHGHIITIDINPCDTTHPRITKIVNDGGSVGDETKQKVKEMVGDKKCLVILDSTHRKQHVLNEMEFYHQFVPKDWYMVVEDTHLGGNPVVYSWGDGPMDAVDEFVKKGTFQIDRSMEKFMLTFNPRGYLKRVK